MFVYQADTYCHWHVASGLAGYGPDAADSDGFPTFGTLAEALDYARSELSVYVDMAHEEAHALADSEDFRGAWEAVVRMQELETMRANLDPSRATAPLYRDNPDAYASLQDSQAADFPHDVTHNSRLYLWACDEPDCEES